MTREAKIEVRCTPEEKAEWDKAAGGQRARSAWARRILNTAARDTKSGASAAEQDASLSGRRVDMVILDEARTMPTPPKGQCSRWMHHRPGVYCASCGKVVAK
jgi:hypothetical protein